MYKFICYSLMVSSKPLILIHLNNQDMALFNFIETGIFDYKKCWDHQESLLEKVVQSRILTGKPSEENYFLLVEHPHVYTLGKSGDPDNLLISPEFLEKIGASLYKINRGGDITYHGPGQIVGYPIIDLEYYHLSIRDFIWKMEEAIIQTIAEFGLQGDRKQGATGVWLDVDNVLKARKICAMGVRVSHYVTMHGFALNVNTDLQYFGYINPCGFVSAAVTSLQKELGKTIDMNLVTSILKEKFNQIY
jgi:lipoyl(octanoyl) transferase